MSTRPISQTNPQLQWTREEIALAQKAIEELTSDQKTTISSKLGVTSFNQANELFSRIRKDIAYIQSTSEGQIVEVFKCIYRDIDSLGKYIDALIVKCTTNIEKLNKELIETERSYAVICQKLKGHKDALSQLQAEQAGLESKKRNLNASIEDLNAIIRRTEGLYYLVITHQIAGETISGFASDMANLSSRKSESNTLMAKLRPVQRKLAETKILLGQSQQECDRLKLDMASKQSMLNQLGKDVTDLKNISQHLKSIEQKCGLFSMEVTVVKDLAAAGLLQEEYLSNLASTIIKTHTSFTAIRQQALMTI